MKCKYTLHENDERGDKRKVTARTKERQGTGSLCTGIDEIPVSPLGIELFT